MVRRRARTPLSVFLNARLVGRLRRLGSGAIDFQYDPSWLDWEHTLPISNSLPLREDRYLGDPVIAVFDNLLPDPEPTSLRRPLAESSTGVDTLTSCTWTTIVCTYVYVYTYANAASSSLDQHCLGGR